MIMKEYMFAPKSEFEYKRIQDVWRELGYSWSQSRIGDTYELYVYRQHQDIVIYALRNGTMGWDFIKDCANYDIYPLVIDINKYMEKCRTILNELKELIICHDQ